tara:strand:- start:972 stop:1193 length:222 start_codon:yes stop_codon:yes gene_type:complete
MASTFQEKFFELNNNQELNTEYRSITLGGTIAGTRPMTLRNAFRYINIYTKFATPKTAKNYKIRNLTKGNKKL